MLAQITFSGAMAAPAGAPQSETGMAIEDEPPDWPVGSSAYDNMVSMANFGYRQIDTNANFAARDWIADELEGMGYEVERQPFATEECDNCENIVVTINGTLENNWMVVGAHHDAICYSPPPVAGITYPSCTSSGAYDDGTGSGSLLELARAFSQWNETPLHTWKLGWWDYEEWQGSSSSEGGGKGSLYFVSQQIPEEVNVTYVNLDMFALNWPVPTLALSQATGCSEDYWTLYEFTSPVSDWSYYEGEGLEVTEQMQADAEWLQNTLTDINSDLSHPTEWVRVIDDTKGNSDHYNFIMAGHSATWIRGQHQNIIEEGDTCEQTPKHAQSDSVTTINNLAGGRQNVEDGLQTGLDIVATLAWWDWNANQTEEGGGADDNKAMSVGSTRISGFIFAPWFIALMVGLIYVSIRQNWFKPISDQERDAAIAAAGTATATTTTKGSSSGVGVNPRETGDTLVESYRLRVLTLCALYVAQGMPWGFITITFVTFLAAKGVSAGMLAAILFWGTLPWTCKFLWGPVIDRYQIPKLGRRRPWILVAETGMIITLSTILLIADPANNIVALSAIFFVYNIFTSLQDVSTDALAVDVLKDDEFEKVNSYMFSAKIFGGMIGGAGLGSVIGTIGIRGAVLLQIPILALIMMVPLLMRERPGDIRFPWHINQTAEEGSGKTTGDGDGTGSEGVSEEGQKRDFKDIFDKLKRVFSLKSARLGLLISFVAFFAHFLIPVLPLLFIQELGWSQEKFNATKGGLMLIIGFFGYMVGGQLGKRFGGRKVAIFSVLLGAMITASWGAMAPWWDNSSVMIAIWALRTFVLYVAAINLYSVMMKITWKEVGGTQYTTYMALMNLSAVVGYALTGSLAGRFDFVTLFYIAGLLETIVIFALFFIDTEETQRVLGGDEDKGLDGGGETPEMLDGWRGKRRTKNQPLQAELIEG
jgi:PAT family beta-lactamase induction signal transducer AmpG